ncbi:MAG: glycosyltransferase [bacterium]
MSRPCLPRLRNWRSGDMRIAYLSTFYPFRGGIAQFNASLFREFEKQHEIRAFTFKRQYPDALFPGATQYVTPTDVVDRVPATPCLDSINPISYLKTAIAIQKFRPELLVMKFWMPFFAPALGAVAGRVRKSAVRTIAILDNLIPHERRPGDRALIKYFLHRNDGFVAMSKIVEGDLLSFDPKAKYVLKPHPLYDHFGPALPAQIAKARLGLPADKRILLFFGFIRDYKGLDDLIRAAAHLPGDCLLVIAGEAYGSFDKYQSLIAETGTAGRIKAFVRYIDDREVPDFFSAAEVCVLPYKSATQSGIVQIAFHFNLPVIVTDVGGLSEMVVEGETGLILRGREPHEVAARVREYFQNNMRSRMSQNIARRRPQYGWAGFAQAILDLYHDLNAGRRGYFAEPD